MIASPSSNTSATALIVLSVISPAGTITHAARGFSSFTANSWSDPEPVMPSASTALTASALTSYPTQRCPSAISRRTIPAPIRPSPTIPNCIGVSVGMLSLLAFSNGRVRGTISCAPMLGLKDGVIACLFDLDGVLTQTAKVHAAAWKSMFDEFLTGWAAQHGERFVPFDAVRDY